MEFFWGFPGLRYWWLSFPVLWCQLVERAFISAAPSLEVHRCNKRFLRFFIQVTFLRFQRFFLFFPRFLFKKTLSNAKYNKYVKIRRKIFLEDDLAMIFIDFSLLRSLYCKISYLLAEEHWSHTNLGIWQPTVCKDNSWIHGKCRQRFLSNVYKRFFFIISTFLRFLTFFFKFSSQRLLHLCRSLSSGSVSRLLYCFVNQSINQNTFV